ncbi:hypothetical protein NAF17_01500 [Mucilaginibacter sp. RB4R14]|uniref:hypothetical protein n=1 Tax=Mucilaginibacter aurantiaciroseus TaxID=2949308 RepID=UPI0020907D82|nr:hypothetical protein [Mucilaginibacter aurantiaciroseus]MCO5934199.1 hypothetical protein [Mucilaginibacter aurantiaciroseus]
MVTGLQLSNQQFQLFQGTGTTPKTSQDLWSIFNAVPPLSVNNFYDPSQANSFASDYGLILSSLVTGSDSDFQNCMGDFYGQWLTYFKTNVPSPFNASTVSDVFNTWVMINAPSQAGCVSALTKAFINPVLYATKIFAGANVSLKLQSVSKTILLQIAHYLPVNPDRAITSKVVNKKILYTLTANTSSPAGNPILIGVLLMPVNLLYWR